MSGFVSVYMRRIGMSEVMTGIPFADLMERILCEKQKEGTIFNIHSFYRADPEGSLTLFGRRLENPIGPAAGPHTQLAQNIIAAYVAGARFFELKTVQKMDGKELAACISRPCILAEDEGYNCEWSTELTVPQAMEEYIKAWVALHVIAKEYSLGAMDGFQFNISVGYDLAGIKEEKVNTFIDSMMEAKDTAVFRECREWLLKNADRFSTFTREDAEAVPSKICNSVTISTLHGCPPKEIESIADYLLKEKHLHTFIKCNPTLLGYDFARRTMDAMGYDYLVFGDFHFKDDLQYEDAVPMLRRLMALSDELGLSFGVKITNTFPVDVTRGELPSEEMYMSGKALYPLSIALAARLSREFDGHLRIAYSGGADYFNIGQIVSCGVWPVTMATTILKTGGYNRLCQAAREASKAVCAPGAVCTGEAGSGTLIQKPEGKAWSCIQVDQLTLLAEGAVKDPHHRKNIKPLPSRKSKEEVPLLDCFYAPCMEGCPIHQDIPAYVGLAGEGRYEEALSVILKKNTLPFITGTLCAHNCMNKCTRTFYEESVKIRETKLLCAEKGYEAVIGKISAKAKNQKRVAIVGAGPAGISAACFLGREGCEVTLFEKEDRPGGVIRYVIPSFRICDEAVEKDITFLEKYGVTIRTGQLITDLKSLKKDYDAVIVCIGAGKAGSLPLEKGEAVNALEFLRKFKECDGKVPLGENVIVAGGGNTAMDTARAAVRTKGVKKVTLVYRRTKRYMPAAEDELLEMLEDGIEMRELLSPVRLENGTLICRKMKLGEPDESGRAGIIPTDEMEEIPADTLLAAVGEKIDTSIFEANDIALDDRGRARFDKKTMETSVPGIYVAGDGAGGAATIVEAIRDAQKAANAILGKMSEEDIPPFGTPEECYKKKGILMESGDAVSEKDRCLTCNLVCENCVDVCPNRANIALRVPGMKMKQILHVDYMCNECGNCRTFCPYASAPYLDKFTLFATEEDMADSKNDGFAVLDPAEKKCKVRFFGKEQVLRADDEKAPLFEGLRKLILAVIQDYRYLLISSK